MNAQHTADVLIQHFRSENPFSYLAPEVLTLVVEAVRVGADVAMIEQWEHEED